MKPATPRPTIYDIARRCETSPSTVSTALNGDWKARRISERTVEAIRAVADELGYAANRQARGLRQSRSGLIGMILPTHDNRFFSSLSQAFSDEARRRDLCPIIVSTDRRGEAELAAVDTLLSYAVDALFIAGATAPDALRERCLAAGLSHVFLDQPCRRGRSVVSDNRLGARWLTERLSDGAQARGASGAGRDRHPGERPDERVGEGAGHTLRFIGGDAGQYATAERIAGFRAAIEARHGHAPAPEQIIACGYEPEASAEALERTIRDLGGLPSGLFINSVSCFEGALRHLVGLPASAFHGTTLGLYDYDPFGAFFPFPLFMVRQDAEGLVGRAFALLDREDDDATVLETVPPECLEPGSVHARP